MATRTTNNYSRFVGDAQRKAATGMLQALILGASEASVLTPIDTSTLLNSQVRDIDIDGGIITGTVGYTAEYALPVHDPDHPQTFRRTSAEKEFLKKGFENAAPSIRAVITGSLKT